MINIKRLRNKHHRTPHSIKLGIQKEYIKNYESLRMAVPALCDEIERLENQIFTNSNSPRMIEEE